jgi:hypothetical protein
MEGEIGGLTARVWESRNVSRVSMGKVERKNRLENPGIDGRTILKWICRKSNGVT